MKSPINPKRSLAPGCSLSDDDLIAYLLGSQPTDACHALQTWLAADPSHGERLCDVATAILFTSEAAANWPRANAADRKSIAANKAPSRNRRVAALLALAASTAFALFSIRSHYVDSSMNSRVAMAWAEFLPNHADADPDVDVSNWLLDQGTQVDISDDSASGESNMAESAEFTATFGFTSDEPPEWLVAAVLAMQTNDPETQSREAAP